MAGVGMVNVDLGQIISGIGDVALKIREAITGKVTPDVAAQIEQQLNLLAAAQDAAQAQIDANEAASNSKFVSYWRPAVAWVCVAAFALIFLLFPMTNYILGFWHINVALPQLDSSTLMTLLFGMLGLGTMRSYDKKQGTSK
jgi:Holin of 3TMs, for gene-transfer release